jgi:predicted transcriptional regulator of viral defense system
LVLNGRHCCARRVTASPEGGRLSVGRAILAAMSANEPAEPQIRLISAASLRATGQSAGQIRTLARRGAIVPIGRGRYVSSTVSRQFSTVPNSAHVLRSAAALADNGPGGVISHTSAALIHTIDLIGDQPAEVTITGRAGGRRGHRNGVHTYANAMPDQHVVSKYGLRVTTPARTVLDLARTLSFAAGVVAADSALHQGLTTVAELLYLAEPYRQRRGGYQAHRVMMFADGLAESPLESLARVAFDEGGLPVPELQARIAANDDFIGRVDFLWRKYKLIVEVDGETKYDIDPRRARKELLRDKALRRAGYEVIHFSWAEITTQPGQVIAAIWAALRARGAVYPAA